MIMLIFNCRTLFSKSFLLLLLPLPLGKFYFFVIYSILMTTSTAGITLPLARPSTTSHRWWMGPDGWDLMDGAQDASAFRASGTFFPCSIFFFSLIFCFSYVNYLEGHDYQDSNSSTSTSMGSRHDMSQATGMFLFLFSFPIMLMFILGPSTYEPPWQEQ